MRQKGRKPQQGLKLIRNGFCLLAILAIQGIAGWYVISSLHQHQHESQRRESHPTIIPVNNYTQPSNSVASSRLVTSRPQSSTEESSRKSFGGGGGVHGISHRLGTGRGARGGLYAQNPNNAVPELSFRQRERAHRTSIANEPAIRPSVTSIGTATPSSSARGGPKAPPAEIYRAAEASKQGAMVASKSLGVQQFPPGVEGSRAIAKGLHIFYYAWYGSPKIDGKWLHWNHKVLPHWTKQVNSRYPQIGTSHTPPEDIGSNYYPEIGPYSSRDPEVIRTHVQQIADAGIGVLVYSWWGRGKGDANGDPTDEFIIDTAMMECVRFGIKLAFHIEPYEGRTAESVIVDTKYIIDKYGEHEALQRSATHHNRTVLYLYDSYHIKPEDWRQAFRTVRGTKYDAVFLGLWVEHAHGQDIKNGGFDGFYNYFAAKGFTYGSEWQNWFHMQEFAKKNNLLFVPSFGPGYIDTAIRPWNRENIRARKGGAYFKEAWAAALRVKPEMLSLTSFNEWHEGTQLEPTKSQKTQERYLDLEGQKSTYYLDFVNEKVQQCKSEFDAPKWCFS